MLQGLIWRSGLFRKRSATVAQIASRVEAADEDFCGIVSDLALISRKGEMRTAMPIVQVAADGRLQRSMRRKVL